MMSLNINYLKLLVLALLVASTLFLLLLIIGHSIPRGLDEKLYLIC